MNMQFDMAQNAALPTMVRPCVGHNCERCDVRDRAICADLSASDRDALSRIGRRVSLKAGQTVMWEGDDNMVVANVVEGTLKLATSTGDGREQIVGVVYASDFIGRPFGARTPHSVTALTDARLCLFPRGAFDGFARDHAELQHRLLQRTLDDLDRTRAWMLLLGRKTAREKVATFLLDMGRRLRADRDGVIDLPLSRQQIADILGITIETVSRQMTELKRGGTIDLIGRRGVRLVDMAELEALAEAG
ncbi:CRP/FNR family transcriptional regulator [Sphingobium sp. OAS761]|uniref:Crp/Fnr family transcriptional regulator n=1 Tax=Sphingobium sp. OAS761 TaxID=2817901 RepID=UPI0020A10CE6|nr:Crp/Fnr family transcriptional regulator [Sphingobium sp. OAS761]MCP1472026.1 CRP/FNR family transcriptional regulator [Sphingobium sp. OAS761]